MAKRKKPAGDYWDVVRIKSDVAAPRWLTSDDDKLTKTEARVEALTAFTHGTTERVYIKSRNTDEEIDLTEEMSKVYEEYKRRREQGDRISFAPLTQKELEEIVAAVLPEKGEG